MVIYLVVPLLGVGGRRAFTAEEKQKVAFIRNYAFPNDRETILEVLLFIQTQMNFLVSEKENRNSVRWARVWKSKADQLYHKAEIMFSGDKISNKAYENIVHSNKMLRRSIRVRIVAAIVLIVGFVAFLLIGSGKIMVAVTFEWPTSGMALLIPQPASNRGKILSNSDQTFWVDVNGISQGQYEQYIDACKEHGFLIEAEKSSYSYEAYNADGYHIRLTYYSHSSKLSIRLEAPMQMVEIRWPNSELAQQLPIPKSNIGNIFYENENSFSIYVGNTPPEDYADYVSACMDNGFTINYARYDTYFWADNQAGYHVRIDYEGFYIMNISIRFNSDG